jgi:hypothetical protein
MFILKLSRTLSFSKKSGVSYVVHLNRPPLLSPLAVFLEIRVNVSHEYVQEKNGIEALY